MAAIQGTSAYGQTGRSVYPKSTGSGRAGAAGAAGADRASVKDAGTSQKIETKAWSPVDETSSLIPRKTEYGNTIGDVKLSDTAKDYYDKLKDKYHNMEFVVVSKDMKSQVQKNAAAYGNANKMVVLIDEEKLERMATDESFRKKYEGIIAMSSEKLAQAKMSLSGSGAAIKNFGMSVDANGKESFFATVEKASSQQKQRIEKKAAEKKAEKAKEKKQAEKAAKEERLRKAKEKRAEKEEKTDKADPDKKAEDAEQTGVADEKEYVTIEADSMDALLARVQSYSFDSAASMVRTQQERMVGTHIDFKG